MAEANPLQPKALYAVLSTPKFADYETPICKEDKHTGSVSLLQKRGYVVYVDPENLEAIRIDSDGSASYYGIGSKGGDVYATDANGNGVKDEGDEGNFDRFQKFLADVKRFADNPDQYVQKCQRKKKEISEYTLQELFSVLRRRQYESFYKDPLVESCPPSQTEVRGYSLISIPPGGFLPPGLTVHDHHLQVSVKMFLDGSFSFIIDTCEGTASLRQFNDNNADGVLDNPGSPKDQQLYEQFIEGLRRFVAHPSIFHQRQCGICP